MIRYLSEHRSHDCNVIDMLGSFCKQFANFDTALPVGFELERRRKSVTRLAFCNESIRDRLASILDQRGLGIKCVYMRGTAIKKKVNDKMNELREVLKKEGATMEDIKNDPWFTKGYSGGTKNRKSINQWRRVKIIE